jgi:aminoglycoside phosphotransferase (APT) family kinase protein
MERSFQEKRVLVMLNYSSEELYGYLKRLLETDQFDLEAVGHHNLGRHFVYKIKRANHQPLIFKLYFKHNRRVREIASLNLLRNTPVKCARIIASGEMQDGTEWLMTSFIKGNILDNLWSQMTRHQTLKMFEAMGEELAKIHDAATFDFFGHWDESGNSLYQFRNYFTEFVRSSEYVFRQIYSQNLPEQVLLNRAISIIRRNYKLIRPIEESRLTHNDYDGRNILVGQNAGGLSIQGVIDFEQSFPGNSEIDLAGIYARYLMGSAHREEAFFYGYEKLIKIDDGFMERLPFYLLCKGVTICSWTYQRAPEYYREGLQLVERFHSIVES